MTLLNWLKECDAFDIREVKIIIGSESWRACQYKQILPYTATMDAVTHGTKKAGDTYTVEAIYCIGELPKDFKPLKNNHVCFPYQGKDWYVAGYLPAPVEESIMKQSHPFGVNFILRPWDIPGSKIDEYEAKPYTRTPMTIE